MDLKLIITNHKLTRTKISDYPNKSNNYLKILIDFTTNDWDNLQKSIILQNNKYESYQFHYTNNGVKIPYDVVKGNFFYITAYGINNEEEIRITTNKVMIALNNSGFTTDIEDLTDVPKDIWEQIFTSIDSKSDLDHKHNVEDILDFPILSNVALTGNYNDLINKPDISSKADKSYVDELIGNIEEDMLL